jgi:hypothetical protein
MFVEPPNQKSNARGHAARAPEGLLALDYDLPRESLLRLGQR